MKRRMSQIYRIARNALITGALTLCLLALPAISGCSTARTIFAAEQPRANSKPISNPFNEYYPSAKSDSSEGIILRTKKGDRSVEVQIPQSDQAMSDFVLPVSPAFKDAISGSSRSPASSGYAAGPNTSAAVDESYKDQIPSLSDREITESMPHGAAEDESTRHEIETGLGLMASEDATPQRDKSYLASVDHVKQLFKYGRYEAALLELDSLLHLYQTDGTLYEMRGTLLDRLGKRELALKSWNQALRFDPNNQGLRRFVERRQQNRSLASP